MILVQNVGFRLDVSFGYTYFRFVQTIESNKIIALVLTLSSKITIKEKFNVSTVTWDVHSSTLVMHGVEEATRSSIVSIAPNTHYHGFSYLLFIFFQGKN